MLFYEKEEEGGYRFADKSRGIMDSEFVFWIIIIFLSADFIIEKVLDALNIRDMSPCLPEKLKGIYDEKEYERFQNYKRGDPIGLIV